MNGKKNGKGKKYGYYGELIFEGEYLNGIINGKGKEYFDNGNIKYEGNYFNGFRHGECIEYYYNGTIRFKGEYLYGKIWNGKVFDFYWNKFFEINNGYGYLREYDYEGKILLSEGTYSNGEKNGERIDYDENGNIQFIGQYLNGERNGYGKSYDSNGNLTFEGEYFNGKAWNGIKNDYNFNNTYNIKNGKTVINEEDDEQNEDNSSTNIYYFTNPIIKEYKNGEIKEYDEDGNLLFEGLYLYNHKRKGKEYHKGKIEFEGEYLHDKKYNGKGFNENGNIIYVLKNGNGKVKEYNQNDELIFEGEYFDGKKSGIGKEYCNGLLVYEGNFQHGKKNGKGTQYNSYFGTLSFEGEFLNDKIWNGKGKEYNLYILMNQNNQHPIIFEGEYLNGKRWNGKMFDYFSEETYELINGKGYLKIYENEHLDFEGEYSNGEKNGIGKEYNFDNILIFEGEFKNGKKKWFWKIV